MKLKSILILLMLITASVGIAAAQEQTVFDQIRNAISGATKSLEIVPWLPGQPYVVQANGISYDTYLTNTAFSDCSVVVVELYKHGANYGITSPLAHKCVSGVDRYNAASILTSEGQTLANNYHPPAASTPAPTAVITTTQPPAPTQPTTSAGSILAGLLAWILGLFGR